MAIKYNEYHKSKVDRAADNVSDYAKDIKHWRENHNKADEKDSTTELEQLYEKLNSARKELKRAIEDCYEIILR